MYLTYLPSSSKDDYEAHQLIARLFETSSKKLWQRDDYRITVLSSHPCLEGESREITEEDLSQGQYMVNLRLNPSTRKNGKRISLPKEKIYGWVKEKLNLAGVEAVFQCTNEGIRRSRKGSSVISLASVLVVGILTVKNQKIFEQSVKNGIGHGKGFGFGLLNVFAF